MNGHGREGVIEQSIATTKSDAKYLYSDDQGAKNPEGNVENETKLNAGEATESTKKQKQSKDLMEPVCKNEAEKEDYPVMGIQRGKVESFGSHGGEISESTIKNAIRERADYIRANSEILTLAGARQLIEEDLELEKGTLDSFKKFIRKQVEEFLCGAKNPEGNVEKVTKSSAEEVTNSPKEQKKRKDLREFIRKDETEKEDSPIMGILTGNVGSIGYQGIEINERTIDNAIKDRASYIRANSETLTLARARQLIEEDLGLNKGALDSFKKFIRKKVEEALDPPIDSKSALRNEASGDPQSKGKMKSGIEQRSGSRDRQNAVAKDKKGTREKATWKGEMGKSERKRCRGPEMVSDTSSQNQSKIAKKHLEEKHKADDEESVSEDVESESSAEKPVKKKVLSTPVYGKHVEHLKSIVKACGMSVPPSVYKNAKQAPDAKRESFLLKELENILSKEGLSKNPSEKEIKEVKRRKERAKELEGIDISNIVTSSRRSSTSFMVTTKPKTIGVGMENAKGTKKDNGPTKKKKDGDDDNSGSHNDDDEVEYDDGDDDTDKEDDGDESQNEEFNEGDVPNSD